MGNFCFHYYVLSLFPEAALTLNQQASLVSPFRGAGYWSVCFKLAKKWIVLQALVNVHMEIGAVDVAPWVCSRKVSL